MLLNFISTPEINFSQCWERGWNKLKRFSLFEKIMTLFWLTGPFIYLLERSPADIWLSIISLVFVIRCSIKREWFWTNQLWFKSAVALWIFGLFSAFLSPDPLFTFGQGFVWIRFPLYVAAAQVWLAKDRDIRILILISMF